VSDRAKYARISIRRDGTVKLVGTDPEEIVQAAGSLLDDQAQYREMSRAINPYGDGKAAQKIFGAIFQPNEDGTIK